MPCSCRFIWYGETRSLLPKIPPSFPGQGALLNQPEVTVALPEWTGVQDEAGLPLLTSTLCVSDLAVLAVGVAVVSADLAAHHGNFTLNNLVACCLAADILQLVGLKSFRVAAVLLAGLLAYDVFWVSVSQMPGGPQSITAQC